VRSAARALTVGGVGQGWLSLSAQSLTFTASCGQQAGSKSVTVTNVGNADIGWTAALGLGAGSPFTIDNRERDTELDGFCDHWGPTEHATGIRLCAGYGHAHHYAGLARFGPHGPRSRSPPRAT